MSFSQLDPWNTNIMKNARSVLRLSAYIRCVLAFLFEDTQCRLPPKVSYFKKSLLTLTQRFLDGINWGAILLDFWKSSSGDNWKIPYCTISTIMLAIKVFLLKNSITKWKQYKNILPAFIRTYSNCFTKT